MRVSLISLGITLGVVLLAAILIPLLFEDQIKGLFIRELNKNLATMNVHYYPKEMEPKLSQGSGFSMRM